MMRSGGRRGNFRGTVESPFLRHRFTDARQDNLLPSLREAAAALCRNADRETLVEVVKLLEGADPRNKLARRAALQLMGDEPRTPAPAPLMPPPIDPFVKTLSVGAIYGAAELHLLTDSSPGLNDTWTFLEREVEALRTVASVKSRLPDLSPASLLLNLMARR